MQPIRRSRQIFSRSADALFTEVGGEVVLVSIPKGHYYALDVIASEIWRKLEHPLEVSNLCNMLITQYNGDPEEIGTDVKALLERWVDEGFVHVTIASDA
jgi:hypothetical protein